VLFKGGSSRRKEAVDQEHLGCMGGDDIWYVPRQLRTMDDENPIKSS
jgi:hypothetical protein